jgi:hypothetical protein
MVMDRPEWIQRCSARLHELWPTVPQEQLAEVAIDIERQARRQLDEPELAATQWLRQGIPDAGLADSPGQ